MRWHADVAALAAGCISLIPSGPPAVAALPPTAPAAAAAAAALTVTDAR